MADGIVLSIVVVLAASALYIYSTYRNWDKSGVDGYALAACVFMGLFWPGKTFGLSLLWDIATLVGHLLILNVVSFLLRKFFPTSRGS